MADSKLDIYLELADDAYKNRDFDTLANYATKVLSLDKNIPLIWFYSGTAVAWKKAFEDQNEALDLLCTAWQHALALTSTCAQRESLADLMNFEYCTLFSAIMLSFMDVLVNDPGSYASLKPALLSFNKKKPLLTASLQIEQLRIATLADGEAKPELKIESPHVDFDRWKAAYNPFAARLSDVVRVASQSAYTANQMNGLQKVQLAISYLVISNLALDDRIPAHNICLHLWEPLRANLHSRFGTSFDGIMDSVINPIREQIRECEEKIKERDRKEYWKAHPEEKAALEAERNELRNKLPALSEAAQQKNAAFNAVRTEVEMRTPEEVAYQTELDNVNRMKSELAGLGTFKGKRKKELSTQIAETEQRLPFSADAAKRSRTARLEFFRAKYMDAQSAAVTAQQQEATARNRLNEIEEKLGK